MSSTRSTTSDVSAEIAEASQEFKENAGKPQELESGAFIETAFFAAVGAAYIPIGLWATITRHTSKVPYVLAIGGSGSDRSICII